MAKGQDYSKTQRGIINRYYDNRDSIMANKLGELVTELYLAEGKKLDTLWGRAEKALVNTSAPKPKVAAIVASRDVKALAELVNTL